MTIYRLTKKQRRKFEDALCMIHDAGVLHGPLFEDDLLVDWDGSVSITGFLEAEIICEAPKSRRKRSTETSRSVQQKKDVECSQLREILQRS